MPRPEDVAARRRLDSTDAPLAGRVSAAPSQVGDSLLVTLDANDHRGQREAVGWNTIGMAMPSVGDEVYVKRADNGKLVVMGWVPA